MPVVIVRCDGGAALGMGHVSRCLALADELRDVHGAGVVFAMRDGESVGVAAVRARAYEVEAVVAREDADYGPFLAALVSSRNAQAIVVDVRDALSRASLEALRAAGVRVVTIDDGSDRRLASDLAFYPPVPQVDEMEWSGFSGRRVAGWDWVLLKREFATGAKRELATGAKRELATGARAFQASGAGSAECLAEQHHTIDILVTMGGSDPAGMTEFVVDALNLLPTPLAIEVVIGPAFGRPIELADAVARSRHALRVCHGPDAMAPLMRASRVAVASFGVSAYELAACGVPAVHLCLSDDHARSASAFEREQIAVSLGVFAGVQPRQVAGAVGALLDDAGRRMKMGARARALVDGHGAARVARLIVDRL